MARKKMVTRTITVTKGTALAIDLTTQESREMEVSIAGIFKNKTQLLNALSQRYDVEDSFKVVQVLDFREEHIKYGMTEDDFLLYSHVLSKDDETNKNN